MKQFFFIIFFILANYFSFAQNITTVAGNGQLGYSGDGNLATNAKLHLPGKVVFDKNGNLYIADSWGQRIRKVDAITGIITTIAGVGTAGYNGDGIPATSAQLYDPCGMAFDASGNLYIADGVNHRIRKVNALSGIITTVAGNGYGAGGYGGFSGDGGPATAAELNAPGYVAIDTGGNLYISDHLNYRIRKVNVLTGIISTYAGSGGNLYSGDGNSATSAGFSPEGIAFDNLGNLFITDTNSAVRKVDVNTSIITTVAGIGILGYSGDSTAATTSEINEPFDICFDASGNYYISEFKGRIRKVDPSGIIYTAAGTSTYGYNGDEIPATGAELNETTGICTDTCGNLYIADASNERIRKVTYDSTCGKADTTHTDTTNAVQNINAGGFSVYPNPANLTLTLSINGEGISSVELINMVGQVVYNKAFVQQNKLTIDISALPTGMYFIKVNDEYVQKVAKE